MKKISFDKNIAILRQIINSLEEKRDMKQLRYIRDGLYHVGGGTKIEYIHSKLNEFVNKIRHLFGMPLNNSHNRQSHKKQSSKEVVSSITIDKSREAPSIITHESGEVPALKIHTPNGSNPR
jgi:hypothetical protein